MRRGNRYPMRRGVALGLAIGVILGLGLVIKLLPGEWSLTMVPKGVLNPPPRQAPVLPEPIDRRRWVLPAAASVADGLHHAATQREAETRILFEHALALLQQGRYQQAVRALELVVTLAPGMPEAFVNLGFALYELDELEAARGGFLRAIELNTAQGNAYYGLAIVYEAQGELELALGAMRSFLHVAAAEDRFRARARAAIWEWEGALGRVQRTDAEQAVGSGSQPVTKNPS